MELIRTPEEQARMVSNECRERYSGVYIKHRLSARSFLFSCCLYIISSGITVIDFSDWLVQLGTSTAVRCGLRNSANCFMKFSKLIPFFIHVLFQLKQITNKRNVSYVSNYKKLCCFYSFKCRVIQNLRYKIL